MCEFVSCELADICDDESCKHYFEHAELGACSCKGSLCQYMNRIVRCIA